MIKIFMATIGLVALGSAAWFLAGGKHDIRGMLPPDDLRQEVTVRETPGAFSGSMSDLLGRTGAWRCTVSMDINGVASEGTTYVSGGKMRSDFTMTIPQVGDMTSHMIVVGNVAYTWSSMLNRGFRIEIQSGRIASGGNNTQATMFNDNYAYDCDAWAVDESMFELPEGITF